MYQAIDASVIRASVSPMDGDRFPDWPDLADDSADHVARRRDWIAGVWADTCRAQAVESAAPVLADAVRDVLDGQADARQTRRVMISLARYLLRMRYRPTPFGLFAGVAPLRVGPAAQVAWGTEHSAVARADSQWLHHVITGLEQDEDVLRFLPVVADATCAVRGSRITVAHQPGRSDPTDTTLRRTRAVEAVLTLARAPITIGDLLDKLRGEHPGTSSSVIKGMLRELVAHRVLLTSLRSPMTCDDELGHLITELEASGAAATPHGAAATEELRRIHQLLARHDSAPRAEQHTLRGEAGRRMTTLTDGTGPVRALAVHVRPDCRGVLPDTVRREAEQALAVMARISPYPNGSPAWQDYRARFLERYSMGTIVPVRELTDPDIGLGFPVGYRGTVLKRPVLATTRRDEHLLRLAQSAALDNRRKVHLAEADIAALSLGEPSQVPAHVELCFSVLSPTLDELGRGRFSLLTAGLSLAAGTTTGRFLTILDQDDRDRMIRAYAAVPTLATGAVHAQVSSPPLRLPARNVARSPAVTPHVLAVGEHNPQATLDLDDLGVVADSQRFYLVSLSSGRIVEPSVMNAVELSNVTHPLVRFVCELHRSHAAILAPFAWGTAASLPFLPEVRVGRTILSSACRRLTAADLGNSDGEGWAFHLADWCIRYGVPRTVYVGNSNQRLRLDLDIPAHQQLLRVELDRQGSVIMHEAPPEAAFGWLGHAHQITMSFASDQPPQPATVCQTATMIDHDSVRLPGTTPWAYIKIYCNRDRADELLTTQLPRLLGDRETGNTDIPRWWFTRYKDPDHHLRVRVRLADPGAFGEMAERVAAWANQLRAEGLVQSLQWDTDRPETGRYGRGPVLDAAEEFFTADTQAALTQLALPLSARLQPAVTAASFVDIASVLLGSADNGYTWLTEHLHRAEGTPVTRDVQALATRLSKPDARLTALDGLDSGDLVARAWELRSSALDRYRRALEGAGLVPSGVLPSLLHMHHNRVFGISTQAEATCRRLARTAALSWTARGNGGSR